MFENITELGIKDYVYILIPITLAIMTVMIEVRKSGTILLDHKPSLVLLSLLLISVPLSLDNYAKAKLEENRRDAQLQKIEDATSKLKETLTEVTAKTATLTETLSDLTEKEASYKDQLKREINDNNGWVRIVLEKALKEIEADYLTQIPKLAKTDELESIAKKDDLTDLATSSEVSALVKPKDLDLLAKSSELLTMASKDDISALAKGEQLANLAEKSDLTQIAKKSDITTLATKSDLADLVKITQQGDFATRSDPAMLDYSSKLDTIILLLERMKPLTDDNRTVNLKTGSEASPDNSAR